MNITDKNILNSIQNALSICQTYTGKAKVVIYTVRTRSEVTV